MKRTLVIICTLLMSTSCQRSDQQDQQQTSPSLQPAPGANQDTMRNEPARAQPDTTSPGSTGDERVNTSGRERGTSATGSDEADTQGMGAGGAGSGSRTSTGAGGSGASTGRGQTGDTTGSGTTGSGTAGPTGRDPGGSPRD